MIPRRKPLAKSRKRIARRTRPCARYRTKGGRNSEPEKLAWLRRQPCHIFRYTRSQEPCYFPPEVHHHRPYGARATDQRTLPLCAWHHRLGPHSVEVLGRKGFEIWWQLDLTSVGDTYDEA